MTAAFIVHLEVEDPLALPEIAEEIADSLASDGHEVVSVAPWQRQTLVPESPTQVSPLSQPAGLPTLPTSPGR